MQEVTEDLVFVIITCVYNFDISGELRNSPNDFVKYVNFDGGL